MSVDTKHYVFNRIVRIRREKWIIRKLIMNQRRQKLLDMNETQGPREVLR